MLIAGGSAYPREWNYAKFREIADSVGAHLLMDMAHISGLVAAGVVDDPFKYADFVTTTTHKSLRGPRSGMIFFKKETTEGKSMIEDAVNNAVFPSCQGGPHINKIGGVAAQLVEVMKPEFKEYMLQVPPFSVSLTFCPGISCSKTENPGHFPLCAKRLLG